MSKDFEGRTSFVTGSAQGIGFAIATILAGRGSNLVLVDRQVESVQTAAQALSSQYGVKVLPLGIDVSKPEEVKAAIARTVEVFGSLDHAVNAAGIPGLKGVGAVFAEYPEDDWNKVMDVNCNAVFYCTKYEIQEMLKVKKGSIVNIASTAGLIAYPYQCAYIASKHAVIGLTKSAALEHTSSGIRINAVAPGFTQTNLLKALSNDGAAYGVMAESVPAKRLARPQEIAELVVFLLSDKASYISGSVHLSDGAHLAGTPP